MKTLNFIHLVVDFHRNFCLHSWNIKHTRQHKMILKVSTTNTSTIKTFPYYLWINLIDTCIQLRFIRLLCRFYVTYRNYTKSTNQHKLLTSNCCRPCCCCCWKQQSWLWELVRTLTKIYQQKFQLLLIFTTNSTYQTKLFHLITIIKFVVSRSTN